MVPGITRQKSHYLITGKRYSYNRIIPQNAKGPRISERNCMQQTPPLEQRLQEASTPSLVSYQIKYKDKLIRHVQNHKPKKLVS